MNIKNWFKSKPMWLKSALITYSLNIIPALLFLYYIYLDTNGFDALGMLILLICGLIILFPIGAIIGIFIDKINKTKHHKNYKILCPLIASILFLALHFSKLIITLITNRRKFNFGFSLYDLRSLLTFIITGLIIGYIIDLVIKCKTKSNQKYDS